MTHLIDVTKFIRLDMKVGKHRNNFRTKLFNHDKKLLNAMMGINQGFQTIVLHLHTLSSRALFNYKSEHYYLV